MGKGRQGRGGKQDLPQGGVIFIGRGGEGFAIEQDAQKGLLFFRKRSGEIDEIGDRIAGARLEIGEIPFGEGKIGDGRDEFLGSAKRARGSRHDEARPIADALGEPHDPGRGIHRDPGDGGGKGIGNRLTDGDRVKRLVKLEKATSPSSSFWVKVKTTASLSWVLDKAL